MSQWLEEKYISLVGGQLRHFHRQSRTTFGFRCPFCGDSKKRTNKTRGYFFLYKRQYFYKCHNCSVSMSLRGFLKQVDAELFREFQLDMIRQERPAVVSTPKPKESHPASPTEGAMFGFGRTTKPVVSLPCVASLPVDHLAHQYCVGRQLPPTALSHLYFSDTWTTWIQELKWSYGMPEDHAPRLIIPWFSRDGELLGAQARRLDATGKEARYITLKRDGDTDKIYGLDRVDFHKTIYLVEGPLDSWFLPNCVAAMGSDLLRTYEHHLTGYPVVFVWDNEPRNLEVSRHLQQAIKRGFPVVIWPPHITEKDLNDMAQAGHDILALIKHHTYSGLRAELEFLRWKKVNDVSSTTAKLPS